MVDSGSDSEVNELCWTWKFPWFSNERSDLHQLICKFGLVCFPGCTLFAYGISKVFQTISWTR